MKVYAGQFVPLKYAKYANYMQKHAKTCKICNHDLHMQNMQKYAPPSGPHCADGKGLGRRGLGAARPGQAWGGRG